MNPSVTWIGAGAVLAAGGTWLERWAARHQPAPPAAPRPRCRHTRQAPVTSLADVLVARLCLDCDEQLPVRTPAWP